MKCKKCKSTNLKIIESGPHNKLVCEDCLTFQKFLTKQDKNTFNSIKGENMEQNIIKGNEELFYRFTELSFMIRNAAGIVQNDMEITENTKPAIEHDINQFKQTMNTIKTELNSLEKKVLNHVQLEKNLENTELKNGVDRYSGFIKDLVKRTQKN